MTQRKAPIMIQFRRTTGAILLAIAIGGAAATSHGVALSQVRLWCALLLVQGLALAAVTGVALLAVPTPGLARRPTPEA